MAKKKVNFRHEITCCECGNVFRSVRSDARFCSPKCKKNASLRSIALRKEIEEHDFEMAVEAEERQVSNNNMIPLVIAIQNKKHQIEVRNNGERLLREYHHTITEREKRMQYERLERQKEIEKWNSTQELMQQEKTRQLKEYLQKVIVALKSIRTHQHNCRRRQDRLDELAYEKMMREQLQLEQSRRRQIKQNRIRKEQQRGQVYGQILGGFIASVICRRIH